MLVLSVVEVTEVGTELSEATRTDDVEDSAEEAVEASVLLVEVEEIVEESAVESVICSVDVLGALEKLEASTIKIVSEVERLDDELGSEDWVAASVDDEVAEEVATLKDATDVLWVTRSVLDAIEARSTELKTVVEVGSGKLKVDMLNSNVSICVLVLVELWSLVAGDDVLCEDTLGEKTLLSVETNPVIVSELLETDIDVPEMVVS